MPINLNALLGGVGQGLEQIGQDRYRQALMQLNQQRAQQEQQKFLFEQQRQQEQQQAGDVLMRGLLGGGGQQNPFGQPGMAPMAPQPPQPNYGPGQIQAQPLAPQLAQVPSYSGAPGGAMDGAALPRLQNALLKLESGNRDYPPDSRAGAVGPGQIMPSTAAGYGVTDPAKLRDPNVNRALSRRISGDLYSQFGGDPDAVAIGYNAGPRRAEQYLAGGRNVALLPGETQQYLKNLHRELDLPPEQKEQATDAALNTAAMTPPQLTGQMTLQQVAQMMKRANPGVPDHVLAVATLQAAPLMNQYGKEQLQQAWKVYAAGEKKAEFDVRAKEADARIAETHEYHQGMLAQGGARLDQGEGKGWQVLTDPTTNQQYRYRPSTGEATTLDMKPYAPGGAAKVASGAQGRQAATQMQRVVNAANEATASLKNLMELPVDSNPGMLMGVQYDKPDGLTEALKRSLAAQATSEDVRSFMITSAGMKRFLATLETSGVATGVQNLAEQMESVFPKVGDTGLNVMRSYAEMRQIVDKSIEAILANPEIGTEQKALLRRAAQETAQAVPFTVADVNALQRQPSDQKVSDFARKVTSGRSGGADADPPPPQVGEVRQGRRFKGGDPADPNNWPPVDRSQ